MFDLKLNLDAAGAGLDRLVKASASAVREAAQAGAEEFYVAAKLAAPVSEQDHVFNIGGRKYGPYKPGNLRDSIYQVYSKSNSSHDTATYHVSFNKDKAPYGFMVLRGTPRVPANDFIGFAFDRTRVQALEISREVLLDAMRKGV
ncbi:hypothetical protein [Comamonas terrigena]|uniref:hypothetical protein n=1 Tax=Comamonas terrigena TaxID=32013 RepID=UPI0028A5B421|nr:hypothetical protein [Comamonas terrigena]